MTGDVHQIASIDIKNEGLSVKKEWHHITLPKEVKVRFEALKAPYEPAHAVLTRLMDVFDHAQHNNNDIKDHE